MSPIRKRTAQRHVGLLGGAQGGVYAHGDVVLLSVAHELQVGLDAGHGLLISARDTAGVLRPVSYLRVPAVTRLELNAIGELVFDNHTDRVTARLFGPDSLAIRFRTPGQLPAPPTTPRPNDVERFRGAVEGPGGGLVRQTYFACFDPSRGLIGGWEATTLTEPPCLTNLDGF